jgi:hypothetical protein
MSSAPASRIAALRILVGGYALAYLVLRFGHFWDVAALEPRRWEPVGVLAWRDQPLPVGAVRVALVAALLAGALFVAGRWYRVVGPVFAALVLALVTMRNSWGQVWHTEHLLVWHLAVLSVAPAADAWAAGNPRRVPAARRSAERYAWAPLLMTTATVTTYVLAGITKLRDAGLEWAAGDILRNQVAYDNVRKAAMGADWSPVAGAVLDHAWVFAPLSVATLAVELGAPFALGGGAARRAWAVAAWLFHVGVLALMAISFPYQLSGVAFASLFAVERPLARIGARLADWRDGHHRIAAARPSG